MLERANDDSDGYFLPITLLTFAKTIELF